MRRTYDLTKFFVLFLALAMIFTATALPKTANAQSIGISVAFGPPPIPYYVQPPDPYPGWIWSPGYWAYDPDNGYYWVPGTWVRAPAVGLYWTPGFWDFDGLAFVWSSGYWGPEVGWYGGVDYGYGYYGNGYVGGSWRGNTFVYNIAVSNVDPARVRSVYHDPGVVDRTWNRTSYHGGRDGIQARPAAGQLAAASARRFGPTSVQFRQAQMAATNRGNFWRVNHGRPATVALARPYSANRQATAYRPAALQRSAFAHPASRYMSAPRKTSAYQGQRFAPAQHAYSSQRMAAPAQHAYASQHRAAPQVHAAPMQRAYAAPQQHYAAPQMMRAAPAAPQMQMRAAPAAPQMRAAPAAPAVRTAPQRTDDHQR